MIPSLSIPTDNIYKFVCLFGLALIISSIFAFVNMYASALDRKIKYSEILISLEAKTQRTKVEEDILAMNKKLIDVTKSNENFANGVVAIFLTVGILLSTFGIKRWYRDIQQRDDRLVELQMDKLEVEIAKLKSEVKVSLLSTFSEKTEIGERDG